MMKWDQFHEQIRGQEIEIPSLYEIGFLGVRAPLELTDGKKRKKFQIAINCSLLLLLAP